MHRSRLILLLVGVMAPVEALSLQLLRVGLREKESAPGNTVFVSEIITAIFFILTCALRLCQCILYCILVKTRNSLFCCPIDSVTPHMIIYARMRCNDTLNSLRNRVRELNHEAVVAQAVSTAQRDFTR